VSQVLRIRRIQSHYTQLVAVLAVWARISNVLLGHRPYARFPECVRSSTSKYMSLHWLGCMVQSTLRITIATLQLRVITIHSKCTVTNSLANLGQQAILRNEKSSARKSYSEIVFQKLYSPDAHLIRRSKIEIRMLNSFTTWPSTAGQLDDSRKILPSSVQEKVWAYRQDQQLNSRKKLIWFIKPMYESLTFLWQHHPQLHAIVWSWGCHTIALIYNWYMWVFLVHV